MKKYNNNINQRNKNNKKVMITHKAGCGIVLSRFRECTSQQLYLSTSAWCMSISTFKNKSSACRNVISYYCSKENAVWINGEHFP